MEMTSRIMLPNIFGSGRRSAKMKVGDAFDYLVQEEEGRLIDMDSRQSRGHRAGRNRMASSFWTRSTR